MVFITSRDSIYHAVLSPYFDVFHDHFYEFLSKDKVPDRDYWTREYDQLYGVAHVQTDFQRIIQFN